MPSIYGISIDSNQGKQEVDNHWQSTIARSDKSHWGGRRTEEKDRWTDVQKSAPSKGGRGINAKPSFEHLCYCFMNGNFALMPYCSSLRQFLMFQSFLVACTRLHKPLRWLVRQSVPDGSEHATYGDRPCFDIAAKLSSFLWEPPM